MGNSSASIAVISTVHDTYDTRIFYKQLESLRRRFRVVYLSPVVGLPEQDWILPLAKSRSKLGRLRTHLSLIRRLFEIKVDLYLLHDPELLPIGIVLACLGKKVVWDMHEDTYNDIKTKTYLPRLIRGPAAWIYAGFQSAAYRVLDGFLLAEDEYGKYFPGSTKTCVVRNYPLLNRLNEVADVPKAPNTLVYIGSISVNRGVLQLIEIVAKVAGRVPRVRLTLIGPFVDAALEKRVRDLVREKGLDQNVVIRGPIRNVEAYPHLAKCMIGLALLLPEPNFTKSLPTKMFEYMALGLPVIVSNFPMWAGIVNRHRVGFALDPLDTEAVCDAIVGILGDERRYSELSRNARAAAREYSWEAESVSLRHFLERIIAA
jgi:glycosyltransferase involved in cell wall biosynthesis